MPNEFYVAPGNNFSGGLSGLGQALQQYGQLNQQRKKEEEMRARLQAGGEAAKAAYESGDPNAMAKVALEYPELSQGLERAYNFRSEATKQNMLQGMRRVLSGEDANAVFEDRVRQVAEAGGDPSDTVREWQTYRENPEASLNNIKMAYASMDPKGYQAMFGNEKPDSFTRKLVAAGYKPGTPEFQAAARKMLEKSGGTTVNVGTGGAIPADEFSGAFGDSGEGKRLEIQARALARKEEIPAQEAIERVALQKDVTQSERTADTYYQRMLGATSDIQSMEEGGFNPTAGDSILEQFPGGNFLVGDDYQQYKATASEWIRAKLRKESGAAIPPEEMNSEFATYFYVPGDSQATIKQKRALRARAEEAMQGERERLGEGGKGRDAAKTVKWDEL
ncbi:hypothetical protein A3724_13820 [Alcanivorax sp. HI0033]|uniref:phage DNA ejection protein n=1 Tax=unclassified Alcanivorax TaxID=2638842 RepID=UPI0007B9EAF7|nr:MULTISPECIES: phage DNA ejection protein [unclassified Alcanivorax]KZX78127.1 hypothetical protein A3717_11660 [Alcanivorax sp. HI0013]KZX83823.1 hypothetical protein A3716_16435 [Alcanivorax sp. HI0011]KZY14078.1 hypothetical protein A3725_01405 [Alcanivorax sp. HI0035]KZX61305.1 hypothetical protein A3713_10060 [Alcanivorax sp. HI0003]KZX65747.1 hypothetical protein A3714_15060 [Alcanivorax sp. HI0007]